MATTTIELTDDQKALLDERLYAVVTDLMRDGSPHSTVVWIDHDDHHVVFNTVRGHLKARNLERDPRMSVLVFDPADPHVRRLAVRGRAQLIDEGADEHIDRLARKYLGQDRYPWRGPGQRRVTVRVIAEKITGGMQRWEA
ncbi:MAG TPA: PPOX class F420-dependent oxidoreductase [Terriglobales bacterium]|nr:PPOX class F420-dependent oxidoreductase [Terriglobales bacterium]